MYEAYTAEEIVSKLPLEASAIASYARKDKLFIGSRQGHLISCNQSQEGPSRRNYEYQVCRTFEKRPIIELRVVESHGLILCLTDAHLSVHDAVEPYKILHTFSKYKPMSALAHFVVEDSNLVFVAISARKRLYIFKWLLNELEEILSTGSILLTDNAQSITWCDRTHLCLSLKGECQFWEIEALQKTQYIEEQAVTEQAATNLPPKSRQLESVRTGSNEVAPLVVYLPDRSLVGIGRTDNNLVDFYALDTGKMTDEYNSCKFSDSPQALVYQQPYLLGILPKNLVEIRSVHPPMLIQKIPLRISMLCLGNRNSVYAANEYQSWNLNSETRAQKNLQFLIEEKQLELAEQLAVTTEQKSAIKLQMASKYFMERKFSRCFEIHTELKTDVLLVLNYFPFLIPDKYAIVLSRYPQSELQLFEVSPENITENERKYGIQALIRYLVARRTEHKTMVNQHYLDFKDGRKEHILSTNDLKRHEATLQLIDTVMLKCYIKMNPSMVGSLLRTKNYCIDYEAEKDLNQQMMYEELLILYERRNMYRRYLELLQKEIRNRESGQEKMVNFLKHLKREEMPLIMEFSLPVLSDDVELGVQIFTSPLDDRDMDGGEKDREFDPRVKFDRETVLQFLKKECLQAVIPYLEYVINKWNDERPRFHEELLEQYILRVRELLGPYLHSLSNADPSIIAVKSNADDQLSVYRKKLQQFLETDKFYTIENAKALILDDENLLEERAIILGRLGEHMDALKIYTETLMDFDAAEHHCQRYHNEKDPSTCNIFFDLFHYYITGWMPQEKTANKENIHLRRSPNVTEALKLFKRHPTKIDTVSAFELIPSHTPFTRICEAVKALFETSSNQLSSTNLIVKLNGLLIQRTKKRLGELKRQRIIINEDVECLICKKRIMNSAFIRNHDHTISHFFCYKNSLEKHGSKKEDTKET